MKNISINKYEIIAIIALATLFSVSATPTGVPGIFLPTLILSLIPIVLIWGLIRFLFKK